MNDRHNFSNDYENKKRAILNALEDTAEERPHASSNVAVKLIAVAALISILTVGVFAATKLIEFSLKQEGDKIQISAKLPDRSDADIANNESKPLRSWRAEDGEISVKLNFGYMPGDMAEDSTAPYKYSDEEFTRALTFVGHDLRRSDFETILASADSYTELNAGGNKTYIVYWDSETAFYNRRLYILFEAEELLVSAYVSYGITDDELREIAENITVTETDNTSEALPIGNEFGTDSTNEQKVFYHENPPEYYADLLSLGDTGRYDGYYDSADVTVKSIEYYDTMADFDNSCIIHQSFVEKFVDENGNLIEYNRTELIRGDGETTFNKWGETVPMTKKFVVVTLSLDYEYGGEAELSKYEIEAPFLHTFSLGELVLLDNGEVVLDYNDYYYNRTPGKMATNRDPVYREYLGDNTWRLGYLLDIDKLEGELYFFSEYADIGYALK